MTDVEFLVQAARWTLGVGGVVAALPRFWSEGLKWWGAGICLMSIYQFLDGPQ